MQRIPQPVAATSPESARDAGERQARIAALGGRALRFGAVGAIATAIQYLIVALLVEIVGADAVAASAAGFVGSAGLNYWLNYRFTFRSRARHRDAALKFALLATAGLMVNSLVMALATHVAGLPWLPAQVLATIAVFVWNFAGSERWAFRDRAAA